jgi:hypothetical protein
MKCYKLESKINSLSNRLSNRILLLEQYMEDIKNILRKKGMEVYNSLNPETMVTPKKKTKNKESKRFN